MRTMHMLLALALLVAGCNGSDAPPVNIDLSNRIYVLAGQGGDARGGTEEKEYVVTLTGVQPEVDWYTDRPGRLTGEERTDDFVGVDWIRVYGDMAPNALLQYRNASGVHGLFGRVRDPSYNAQTRTLKLTLTLSKASYDISGGVGGFDSPVLTLLNNLKPPAEGSSFALQADRAQLVADGAGGYRLLLQGVDDGVFWMNNAPARGGDFEAVGNFINYWDERFADSLPNASLAGDLGDGNYEILPLTLSMPAYDASLGRVSFAAVPLRGPGTPDVNAVLSDAVLFVDAGERGTPSTVFSQTWRGVAYSPIPGVFNSNPTGAFFDSDMTADNFQAIWGRKNGCGRDDLETMAAAGVNLVRLYDYNYQRGSTQWKTGGNGHIPFLDKAQSLGIKVIIPVSNYNLANELGGNRPWDDIDNTVAQIVNSVKKNGVIHPAVHSFSVGNELDLDQYGMDWTTLIPRAVQVAGQLNTLAPDHFITIPVSNAYEKKMYAAIRDEFSKQNLGEVYKTRVYNAVQTFKRKDGDDLLNNILKAYDNLSLGVPLVITELGTSNMTMPSVDAKVEAVVGQASVVRTYMDANPSSQVKGFAIFQWQNAHWKRGGSPNDNTESTFGIHAYNGTLCSSKTGKFYMEGMVNGQYVYALFHDDVSYDVDQLAPLTSAAYPGGLLQALSAYFK